MIVQDMHSENLLAGVDWAARDHPEVVEHRVYIIDFDSSRQFTLGPGVQPAITLPATVQVPPNGMARFDPYSWDIYCVGRTLEYIVKVRRLRLYPKMSRCLIRGVGHIVRAAENKGAATLDPAEVPPVAHWERAGLHRRVLLSSDGAYCTAGSGCAPMGRMCCRR